MNAVAPSLHSTAAFDDKLSALKWMAGSWQSSSPAGTYANVFTDPSGGLILGLTKLVDRNTGQVSFYEYYQIKMTGDGLAFSPMPFGQPAVSFPATDVSATRVVFENPAHDFPRKITYELGASGNLVSTVEGVREGQAVKMQFVMQKK